MSINPISTNINLDTIRHSFAHLMAAAVEIYFKQEAFVNAKKNNTEPKKINLQFGVGPVIENGCYYDFILPRNLVPEDLKKIEKIIRDLIKKDLSYTCKELEIDEAIEYFKSVNQPLKVELLENLRDKGTTSLSQEEFKTSIENKILTHEFQYNIKQSSELMQSLLISQGGWETYYNSLILKLNTIDIKNWEIIKRNIKITEPVVEFSYKRKMNGKFVKEGKVRDIFDLIKFLKTVISHEEADHLITVDENNNTFASNLYIGYNPNAISLNGINYGCDYHDDVAIQFGKGKVYIKRHLVAFVDQLLNLLDNSVDLFDLPTITTYSIADNKNSEIIFTDLCKGPHIQSIEELKNIGFALDKFSAAYWRGDQERGINMQRLYALVYESQEELDKFIADREEAKRRDHRVLNAQHKWFSISELVGSGLALMQPKGQLIRKQIQSYLWQLHRKQGYQEVWTPHMAKEALYQTSGHAKHYLDDMFSVYGGTSKESFYLKPMNCPHHMQLFADQQFSYKDMPIRYFEHATVYRDEKTGQLSGLTRVRNITQDDGHLFARLNQLDNEVDVIVAIIKQFMATFEMIPKWVSLSIRDGSDNWLGDNNMWTIAQEALKNAAIKHDIPYKIVEGEAAFYGPKLDFMFEDCIGRQQQLSTIQIDFNLPERFDLSFTNENGEKERPVVVHRAIAGSAERFMGVMIEHYAGKFPFWLAPEQIRILTINDQVLPYVTQITDILDNTILMQPLKYNEIRHSVDSRSESLGKKIREAKNDKIPMLIVIGQQDVDNNQVSIEYNGESVKVGLNELKAWIVKI